MKRRTRQMPDNGLRKPVKKFNETFSGEDAVVKWCKEQGATESVTFDEETGHAMRTFTIKLK